MATYGSVAGANELVPEWDGSDTPTTEQVTAWLADAYARINLAIGSAGYSTPVSSSAAVYAILTGLENLYAGAYVLRARGIDTTSGDAEERSEVWLKDFNDSLAKLAAANLSVMGVALLPSTSPTRRRRIRTIQMRKVDGYSRGNSDETYEVQQGEYTGYTPPSE